MTLPEAGKLFSCWIEDPPPFMLMRIAVEGWFGKLGMSEEKSPNIVAKEMPKVDDLFGVGHHGMPEPVLDFAIMRERNRQRAAERAKRERAS